MNSEQFHAGGHAGLSQGETVAVLAAGVSARVASVGDVIRGQRDDELARALRAAYWAGRASMRAEITEDVGHKLRGLPVSRYHRFAAAVANYVAAVPGISQGYLHGNGDSGRAEAAEIMAWTYPILGGVICAE